MNNFKTLFGSTFKLDDSFFSTFEEVLSKPTTPKSTVRPLTQTTIEDDGTILQSMIEVPGFKSKDLTITTDPSENKIHISGTSSARYLSDDDQLKMKDVYIIGKKWDVETLKECKCEDGILYLKFGLKESSKAKTIRVD
jgi:HSP20 family molecular chaperone IbpA